MATAPSSCLAASRVAINRHRGLVQAASFLLLLLFSKVNFKESFLVALEVARSPTSWPIGALDYPITRKFKGKRERQVCECGKQARVCLLATFADRWSARTNQRIERPFELMQTLTAPIQKPNFARKLENICGKRVQRLRECSLPVRMALSLSSHRITPFDWRVHLLASDAIPRYIRRRSILSPVKSGHRFGERQLLGTRNNRARLNFAQGE